MNTPLPIFQRHECSHRASSVGLRRRESTLVAEATRPPGLVVLWWWQGDPSSLSTLTFCPLFPGTGPCLKTQCPSICVFYSPPHPCIVSPHENLHFSSQLEQTSISGWVAICSNWALKSGVPWGKLQGTQTLAMAWTMPGKEQKKCNYWKAHSNNERAMTFRMRFLLLPEHVSRGPTCIILLKPRHTVLNSHSFSQRTLGAIVFFFDDAESFDWPGSYSEGAYSDIKQDIN